MIHRREHKAIQRKFWFGSPLLAALILATVTLANSQEEKKVETIDATAMGISTQLGKNVA